MKYYYQKRISGLWLEHYYVKDDNGKIINGYVYSRFYPWGPDKWRKMKESNLLSVSPRAKEITEQEFNKALFIHLL